MKKIYQPIAVIIASIVMGLVFFGIDYNVHYVQNFFKYIAAICFILVLPVFFIKLPPNTIGGARIFLYILSGLISMLIVMGAASSMASSEVGYVESYSYEARLSSINKKKAVKNSSATCDFGAWWYDTKFNTYIYQCTNKQSYEKWLENPVEVRVKVDAKIVLWGLATKVEKHLVY